MNSGWLEAWAPIVVCEKEIVKKRAREEEEEEEEETLVSKLKRTISVTKTTATPQSPPLQPRRSLRLKKKI